MAARPETLLRYIRRLVIRPEPAEASDAALLGRFLATRDDRAFAALVERHGPQVLQVCWRVLGNIEDAEDAFQATFLVLARKASTVRPPERLAAWLHGVARRAACKVRSARARQLRQAQSLAAPAADPRPDPLTELSARELLAILDEEVERLPEMYRLPVILCCLQGRSQEEAARQLGWTPGSVKGRLERGRARLHDRLVRRGLTVSAALAAAEVSRGAASAAVVARLVSVTARGALLWAARPTPTSGASTAAAALAGDLLRGMALARLKVPALLVLGASLLAAGFLTYRVANPPAAAAPHVAPSPLASEEEAPAAAAPGASQPALPQDDFDAPIAVSGRVLDPEGHPVSGARLYLGYAPRPSLDSPSAQPPSNLLRATSKGDGRFRFTFARSELDARLQDAWRPAVLAVADGFGPDWVEIREGAANLEVTLKLVEDLPIEGRILDPDHRPVPGAEVRVLSVLAASEEALTRYLRGEVEANDWSPRTWRGPVPGQPAVLTTDGDGRFRVTGLGRDRIASLALESPAIRHAVLSAVSRPAAATPFFEGRISGATFEYLASAVRPIRGVVRDRTTGKPVPGVRVNGIEMSFTTFSALTDGAGRYELRCWGKAPNGYTVAAQPPAGQPYFAAARHLPDEPGSEPLALDFDLVSGIVVHGRVTDQATHQPPRAALVEYYPLFPNAHSAGLTNRCRAASSCPTGPDGAYSLVVLPGPGIVGVAASPRDSYSVALLDRKELAGLCDDGRQSRNAFPEGGPCPLVQNPRTAVGEAGRGVLCVNCYSALALVNPPETTAALALDLRVQRAGVLRGTVAGPDGRPLTGVRVLGLKAMPEDEVLEEASFTVKGLNPRGGRDLYFRHEKLRLGRFLTIDGNESPPLTVQLEPCGTVIGRVVDRAGKPVAGANVSFARLADSYTQTIAALETDGQGRFQADLVPGPVYAFWEGPRRLLTPVRDVRVESGRSTDLGDLVVDEPSPQAPQPDYRPR